jgi:hypothetical protein
VHDQHNMLHQTASTTKCGNFSLCDLTTTKYGNSAVGGLTVAPFESRNAPSMQKPYHTKHFAIVMLELRYLMDDLKLPEHT